MANTALKGEKVSTPKKTGKTNVSQFPKPEVVQVKSFEGYPVDDLTENARLIFGAMMASSKENEPVSFDTISDLTDLSFDDLNTGFKELEESNLIDRLPELEYQIKPLQDVLSEKSGNDTETTENAADPEATTESFDILKEVDGSKLKDAVARQKTATDDEEAEQRVIKLPRKQRLPDMEESGAILELEENALSHEDCAHTIKLMKKKQETLRSKMLQSLKEHNLSEYKHAGFVVKRESKGETVKVVSVSYNEDEE